MPIGRPKCTRSIFRETGSEAPEWLKQAQDRLRWWNVVNNVMNFPIPYDRFS
jgi:hypothetical protein